MGVIIETALQQGFLYSLVVFGLVISFRMMNFPDLTVDGAFTLGGAVIARLLVSGVPIGVSILVATFSGFLAGVSTALLNRKLGISKILSGILVMLILYSVNLRVMGKANISLLRTTTAFTFFENTGDGYLLAFLAVMAILALIVICYFSLTRLGLFIRATGDNEFMVRSQGINTDSTYIIGIGLANALVAFSGAMVSQNQGFADVSMGTGMIITALAALIIGESFLGLFLSLKRILIRQELTLQVNRLQLPWESFGQFAAALLGAFLYFLIVAVCLQLGLAPTDLKMGTGILVIIGIAIRFKKTTGETYQKSQI